MHDDDKDVAVIPIYVPTHIYLSSARRRDGQTCKYILIVFLDWFLRTGTIDWTRHKAQNIKLIYVYISLIRTQIISCFLQAQNIPIGYAFFYIFPIIYYFLFSSMVSES